MANRVGQGRGNGAAMESSRQQSRSRAVPRVSGAALLHHETIRGPSASVRSHSCKVCSDRRCHNLVRSPRHRGPESHDSFRRRRRRQQSRSIVSRVLDCRNSVQGLSRRIRYYRSRRRNAISVSSFSRVFNTGSKLVRTLELARVQSSSSITSFHDRDADFAWRS